MRTEPQASPPEHLALPLRTVSGPERLVFSLAGAAIALHAIDDAFVNREPGVQWTAHIAAAALPVALIALAIWLYPRMGAGVRAALAVVLGALALVGAQIAITHSLAQGSSGDDWTGLLLAPAGVALGVLGVWVLWRSRKRSGHRVLRRVLIGAAAVVVAYELVVPLGMAIFATHRSRVPVAAVDLGRPVVAVSVTTRDGLLLHGSYVPSRNGAAVIVFPREWTADQARLLARHGYGVLMLDLRGYGDSQGAPNAFGWGSTRDIDAAVAYLQSRPDVESGRIGGIGLSVGGEQMLQAAAGNPGLRAVVSEGAGSRSVREELLYGLPALPSIPSAAVQTAALTVLSGHLPPPALTAVVAKIAPRPIMLIYAGHGGGGEELQPRYFAAARGPKYLWMIPEAGHTGGYRARPAEYERRVVGFFDQTLLGET